MSEDPIEGKFAYDGQLVFNGIHITDLKNSSTDPETVTDNLTTFSEGTADNSGSGYQKIPVAHLIENSDEIDDKLKSVSNNLSSFRYIYEKWNSRVADVDGTRRVVKVPNEKDVDIYWSYPDYMFFRGQRSDTDQTEEDIEDELDGVTDLDTISFDEDFLLWMLYKYHNNDQLSSSLQTRLLTDCQTTGSDDNYGGRNIVGDSTDICKSVPLLDALLRQKKLSSIEGNFVVADNHVGVEIDTRGRVHVKASRGEIKSASPLRRVTLSLKFLNEFTAIYENWRDNMPYDKKYPPDSFFKEIRDVCDSQGNLIKYPIKPVLDEYRGKRASGP